MSSTAHAFWQALLFLPWWTWQPATATAWEYLYHLFNLLEAMVWFAFSGLVLMRTLRTREAWEFWYANAFFAFGLTDLREAYVQSCGLVLLKGGLLVILWRLRRRAILRDGGTTWW